MSSGRFVCPMSEAICDGRGVKLVAGKLKYISWSKTLDGVGSPNVDASEEREEASSRADWGDKSGEDRAMPVIIGAGDWWDFEFEAAAFDEEQVAPRCSRRLRTIAAPPQY